MMFVAEEAGSEDGSPDACPAQQPLSLAEIEPLPALAAALRCLFAVAAVVIAPGGEGALVLDHAREVDPSGLAEALPGALASAAEGLVVEGGEALPCEAALAVPSFLAGVRFLAGIRFGDGGGIALFDAGARALSGDERARLREFAMVAAAIARLDGRARRAAAQGDYFRRLAEGSTDTIVRGDLDGVRHYVSPAVRSLLGYEPEELVGRRAMEISHPDDAAAFAEMMRKVRASEISVARLEHRQRHKNGSWVWLETHLSLTRDSRTGEVDGYVASVRGIGERKKIEARLEHMALHDELTGLPNRKLFRDRLMAALETTRAGGPGFALLWIDLDRFKDINDGLGHQAGDAVLREAARRLRAVSRAGDVVARLGGDEFALIARTGGDRARAERLAARLISAMETPVCSAGETIAVGLSVGVAGAPEHGLDADELLAAADVALYEAKSLGRGTFRLARGEEG